MVLGIYFKMVQKTHPKTELVIKLQSYLQTQLCDVRAGTLQITFLLCQQAFCQSANRGHQKGAGSLEEPQRACFFLFCFLLLSASPEQQFLTLGMKVISCRSSWFRFTFFPQSQNTACLQTYLYQLANAFSNPAPWDPSSKLLDSINPELFSFILPALGMVTAFSVFFFYSIPFTLPVLQYLVHSSLY